MIVVDTSAIVAIALGEPERQDFVAMTQTEQQNLAAKGLTFNSPDLKPFREILAKNGFYPDCIFIPRITRARKC